MRHAEACRFFASVERTGDAWLTMSSIVDTMMIQRGGTQMSSFLLFC